MPSAAGERRRAGHAGSIPDCAKRVMRLVARDVHRGLAFPALATADLGMLLTSVSASASAVTRHPWLRFSHRGVPAYTMALCPPTGAVSKAALVRTNTREGFE